MKIKYFDTFDYDLEEAVNDFIKDKKVVDIKFQNNLCRDDELITSILVMYED